MSRSNAAIMYAKLPNVLQHKDVVQAAEHLSNLATDIGYAFDCVRYVLGELSRVTMPFLYQAVLSHLYPEFCRACSVSNLADCCTFLTCSIGCHWSLMPSSQRLCKDCKPKLYRSVTGNQVRSGKKKSHR